MTTTAKAGIFANRSFVLAAISSFISLMGDQLTLIAMPWLMLNLTGSAKAVGLLLGLIGMPRAICFLVGGALADKTNPRYLLTVTRFASTVLLGALAMTVWRNEITPDLLYVFAACLGLASATGMPASTSILPRLLPKEQLGAGNAVVMAGAQFSGLLGPALSGALLFLCQKAGSGQTGFALAFLLDALSFLFALVALQFLNLGGRADGVTPASGSVFDYLRDGWKALQGDRSLLSFVIYLALINLFTTGPVMVGIPLLVSSDMHGTAWDYGSFLATMNIGVLCAMVGSARLPAPPPHLFSRWVVSLDCIIGLLMIVFVNLKSQLAHQAILFLVGIFAGYIQVSVVTRIQKRADQQMVGRIMGYVMFAYLGLVPVSASFAGWVIAQSSAVAMFEIMGAAISIVALLFLLNKDMRALAVEGPVATGRA